MPARRPFALKMDSIGDQFWNGSRHEKSVELHLLPTGMDGLPPRVKENSIPSAVSQLAQFSELGAMVGNRPSTYLKSRFSHLQSSIRISFLCLHLQSQKPCSFPSFAPGTVLSPSSVNPTWPNGNAPRPADARRSGTCSRSVAPPFHSLFSVIAPTPSHPPSHLHTSRPAPFGDILSIASIALTSAPAAGPAGGPPAGRAGAVRVMRHAPITPEARNRRGRERDVRGGMQRAQGPEMGPETAAAVAAGAGSRARAASESTPASESGRGIRVGQAARGEASESSGDPSRLATSPVTVPPGAGSRCPPGLVLGVCFRVSARVTRRMSRDPKDVT